MDKDKALTRNELLELANTFYTGGFTEREIAFARVIAAAEREACAVIVENMNSLLSPEIAAAIRARRRTHD
jgi:predicted transcriptional regulator